MGKRCILVLGGARGGKSQYAQDLASKLSEKVLFVATGQVTDEEMRLRIENHKQSRPETWHTLESSTNIGKLIQGQISEADVVIIDCITFLVANLMGGEQGIENREKGVITEIDELINCIDNVNADFIIVSNEVGLGIVPENKLARLYRDFLGKANQMLAQRADEVYLLVAGLAVELKSISKRE